MNPVRHPTSHIAPPTTNRMMPERGEIGWQRLIASGGVLGALVATACCMLPLFLFSIGMGGAWIANLTALAPYKPIFMGGTMSLLAYGFYLVYWKPRRECVDAACARPVPSVVVQSALWIATLLVAAAFAFDYIAALLLSA